MKYYRNLLHFFMIYLGFINLSSSDAVEWFRNCHHGDCYLEYDCQGSKAEFWERSWENDLSSLEFKNCSELKLNTLFQNLNMDNFRKFTHLSITNTPTFVIPNNEYPNCLPSNLYVENVDYISNFDFLRFDKQCEKLNLTLKHLSLYNVKINVTEDFIISDQTFDLQMNEVYINIAEKSSLKFVNKNGQVIISNSIIEIAKSGFMNFNAYRVEFVGNQIRNFKESVNLFSFDADKVILKGNVIKTLTKKTMKISSDDVKIAQNIIERMDENAFESMREKSALDFSFEFSDNIIYFLSLRNGDCEVELFTKLTITGNIIDFCCENNLDFELSNWGKVFRNFYSERIEENNQIKCWKFPDCSLSFDVQNYLDLCESHCKCLVEDINENSELDSIDLDNGNMVESESYNPNGIKLDNASFNVDNETILDRPGENLNRSYFMIFSGAFILTFIGCIVGFILGYIGGVYKCNLKRSPKF